LSAVRSHAGVSVLFFHPELTRRLDQGAQR
jgi:hypothetical protein